MIYDVSCPYCQSNQDTVDWTEGWSNDGDEFIEECGSCGKSFEVTVNLSLNYDVEKINKEEDEAVKGVKCECSECGANFLESEMKRIPVSKNVNDMACPECDNLTYHILNEEDDNG